MSTFSLEPITLVEKYLLIITVCNSILSQGHINQNSQKKNSQFRSNPIITNTKVCQQFKKLSQIPKKVNKKAHKHSDKSFLVAFSSIF